MSSVIALPKEAAIQRYERAMLRADTVIEAGNSLLELALHENVIVTQDHIDFLASIGGLAKLREAFFQGVRFDLEYGTKTFKFISEDEMKKDAAEHPEHFAKPENAKHGVKHRPSLTNVIKAGINAAVEILRDDYGIDVSDASFFDLGTGTGKPLIIAAKEHSFASAIGIDYNEPLIKEAKQNLRAVNLHSRKNVKALFADATEFRKFNGTNVVFMYNPFLEPVMKEVEKNLRRNAGKTIVVYNKPQFASLFSSERGWSQVSHLFKGKKEDGTFDADHETLIFSRGFDKHPIKNPSVTGEMPPPEPIG